MELTLVLTVIVSAAVVVVSVVNVVNAHRNVKIAELNAANARRNVEIALSNYLEEVERMAARDSGNREGDHRDQEGDEGNDAR